MAKSKRTTEISLIAILAAKLDALYTRPDADGFRTFTEAEHIEAEALETVIATTEATGRQDALVQLAVATGFLDLVSDGAAPLERLELAHAALASATRALEAPKPRRAA